MEKFLGLTTEEQYRVNEEVALSRIFNSEQLKAWNDAKVFYDKIKEDPTISTEDKNRARAIMIATQEMVSSEFEKIARLAERGATIEQKMKSIIDANTFILFIDMTLRIVYDTFFDGSQEMARKFDHFEETLRETLVFREANSDTLQPVREYEEMIHSVPSSPVE